MSVVDIISTKKGVARLHLTNCVKPDRMEVTCGKVRRGEVDLFGVMLRRIVPQLCSISAQIFSATFRWEDASIEPRRQVRAFCYVTFPAIRQKARF